MRTGPKRGLVYHTGALGDLIVAVPAIAYWARALDVDRLLLLDRGHPGALLQAAGVVDERLDAGAAWLAPAYRGAPPRLPAPVDAALAFTAPGGPLARGLAAAVPGPVSVVRPTPVQRQPIVRHHLRAVGAGPADERAPTLSLPPAPRAGRRVGIAPGSGSRRKNWPLDRFAAVADALRHDADVLWLLGPAEAALAPPAAAGDRIVRGQPLARAARAIGACTLLVANDSGLAHLAAALSVPLVALFAVSDAAVWAPAAAGSPVLVVTPTAVVPGDRCRRLPPPAAGASMDDVAVDPVLTACRRLLG